MRRTHPFFSPLALAATALLLATLAVALFWSGGRAFSPGPLSDVAYEATANGDFRSHAEFNDDCSLCHAPFAGLEARRCGACHQDVLAQIDEEQGLHAPFGAGACHDCHTDHKGPEFDMSRHARQHYSEADHAAIFLLDGSHAALACAACHGDERYASADAGCPECHQEPERHAGQYGLDCQRCHTTTGWEGAIMTHHPFPLDHGLDIEVPCAGCHSDSLATYDCTSCHEHRRGLIERQHREVDLSETPLADCASCHPDGAEVEVSQ